MGREGTSDTDDQVEHPCRNRKSEGEGETRQSSVSSCLDEDGAVYTDGLDQYLHLERGMGERRFSPRDADQDRVEYSERRDEPEVNLPKRGWTIRSWLEVEEAWN